MAKKKNADQDTADATPAAAKSPEPAPVAPPRAPAKKKIPKLAKKNKSRLPRKQKKALQKAANQK
jgi:hypothetical protein